MLNKIISFCGDHHSNGIEDNVLQLLKFSLTLSMKGKVLIYHQMRVEHKKCINFGVGEIDQG